MIFMAPMTIIVRAFYALGDYATPAKLGLAALAVYTVASGLLVGRYSYAGIGMAYAIFWCFTLVVHSYALGNKVGHLLRRGSLAFLGKVGLSSLAAGGAVQYIAGPHHPTVARYCGPGGATGVGLAIFIVLTHYVFRVPQFRMLFACVTHR
jgi:peptidoglycan biosynthesis protein MviN/MurJ (putative lipid II flippase)